MSDAKNIMLAAIKMKIKNLDLLLIGEMSDDKSSFSVEIDNIADFLADILDNKDVVEVLKPILPDKMEFKLTILKNSDKKKSVTYYEFVIEWENKTTLRIVKVEDKVFFQVYIPNPFLFKNLPLIGDSFEATAGISALEMIYIHQNEKATKNSSQPGKKDKPIDLRIVDLRSEPLKNDTKLKLSDHYNIFVTYNSGKEQRIFSYPPVAREASLIPNSTPAVTTQPANKEKSSSFKVSLSDLTPEFDTNTQTIGIGITATLAISAFKFQLIGLGATVPLSILNDFSVDNLKEVRPTLKGMSLEYQSSSFSVMGAFYREHTELGEEYNGILIFKLKKIELIAIGSYIKTENYSSIFAFAYLGVPIPLHPSFVITGLALGFGINRQFTPPKISEIVTFPLLRIIKDGGFREGETVKDFFGVLNVFLAPKEGAFFIIAGLRFDLFKMLDTLALVTIAFDNGLLINMMGISSLRVEKAYNIELAFSLTIDLRKGEILAIGELTENTFLLFPGIKLTGSFAFGLWVAGDNSGDFVISLGGYHPKFKAPNHYPQGMKRLGIKFNLIPNLLIEAGVYFALTPQCIMAGIAGKIHYDFVYSSLVDIYIKAQIDFNADFIIFWKPFAYEAEIQVSIFLNVKIKTFFININESFSMSAGLKIWGPDFSGIAYFKVAGYQVECSFGSGTKNIPQLTKEDFKNEFLAGKDLLTLKITGGVLKNIKSGDKEIALINAKDLLIEFNSVIPISQLRYGDTLVKNQQRFGVAYKSGGFENEVKLAAERHLRVEGKKENLFIEEKQITSQSVPASLWKAKSSNVLAEDSLVKDLTTGGIFSLGKTINTKVASSITASSEYNESVVNITAPSSSKIIETGSCSLPGDKEDVKSILEKYYNRAAFCSYSFN